MPDSGYSIRWIQHPASNTAGAEDETASRAINVILGEPAPTAADLHFRLFGIPVRVHPFFWLVSLLLGMGGGPADPVETLIWVAVVFVSILVHELGHAFTQRRFGGRPWITLYSFGGLASCNDCDRSPRSQILILLAGPAAGFVFAAAVVLLMRLSGHYVGVATSESQIDLESLDLERVWVLAIGPILTFFEPLASRPLSHAVGDLLQVNILWGLVNLLPLYPLDGGQIARELFTLGNPRAGIVQSLQLSVGAAILVAVYALMKEQFYTCVMFGFLAYGSYQALAAYRNHWR
jgi:stage IV sporulation protein FB